MLVTGEDAHNSAAQINCQSAQVSHIINLHFAMRNLGMLRIRGEIRVGG